MAKPRLDVLGGFAFTANGRALSEPSAKKAQALLAYLALQGRRALTRDHLAGLLWGDRDNPRARHSLSQALAAVRRGLDEAGVAALDLTADSVRFDASTIDVDALLLVGAPAADAAQLYRGELLAGFNVNEPAFEAWLLGEHQRFKELALTAISAHLDRQTAGGAVDDAIATALRLLTLDPLQEGVHRRLMTLYEGQGRTDAALRQYQNLEKLLERELGAEPDAETRVAYAAIVRGRSRKQTAAPASSPLRDTTPPASGAVSAPYRSGALRSRALLGAAAAVLLMVGAIVWWRPWVPPLEAAVVERMAHPFPDRPSIAVLPFANLSDDKEQEYFADGVVDDIIADLARLPGLFVIARNSTFAYKGKPSDVRTVARELGVKYVLEGSVRRVGATLRVTAQLIDAEAGGHVWGERYDRDITELPKTEIELSRVIVGAVERVLDVTTHRRSAYHPEAYDLLARARKEYLRATRDGIALGRQLAERAIALDPTYAAAYGVLANTVSHEIAFGMSDDPPRDRARALALAEKAVSVDASEWYGHFALGRARFQGMDHDGAIAAFARAIELNPNDPDARVLQAQAMVYAGRSGDAVAAVRTAMRLNPFYAGLYPTWLGAALYFDNAVDEAAQRLEEALRLGGPARAAGIARSYLAAAYARTGQTERAAAVAKQILAGALQYSAASFAAPYKKPADRARLIGDLRAAGLPE